MSDEEEYVEDAEDFLESVLDEEVLDEDDMPITEPTAWEKFRADLGK